MPSSSDQLCFLKGSRVFLRPLDCDDIGLEYTQWLNDSEVCRYNSHATFPLNVTQNASYNSANPNDRFKVSLAIIAVEQGVHIGNVSLQAIDWISRSAEFAILLGDKNYWGKGLATEAANLIIDYGFLRLNLHRIYCGTSSENLAMQSLAQKLNMEQEGRRREAMYKNGSYFDVLEYGILRQAWLERKASQTEADR